MEIIFKSAISQMLPLQHILLAPMMHKYWLYFHFCLQLFARILCYQFPEMVLNLFATGE
jgi:hypothetical protein